MEIDAMLALRDRARGWLAELGDGWEDAWHDQLVRALEGDPPRNEWHLEKRCRATVRRARRENDRYA